MSSRKAFGKGMGKGIEIGIERGRVLGIQEATKKEKGKQVVTGILGLAVGAAITTFFNNKK